MMAPPLDRCERAHVHGSGPEGSHGEVSNKTQPDDEWPHTRATSTHESGAR